MTRNCRHLAACLGLAALLAVPSTAWAQTAPNLGVAGQFGALGGSAVSGSTAPGTVVNGDVGSYPTPAVTNFPPSTTVPPFTVHFAADGVVQQAQTDARAAYTFLFNQGGVALTAPPAPDELGGRTLTAGVYSLGAANLVGTLTLSGPGPFIFNIASTLTTAGGSQVVGTSPCNVFWRVGSSATLNGSSFIGTVIAEASITLGGGNVTGRLLALTAAVTMPTGGNTIGGCSTPPPVVCPTITLSPPTAPNGTVGVAYSQTVTGSGGTAPYTFAVASGTLPAGVTLSTAGVLSGTPTTAGSTTVTIRGTDANGCSGVISYTITIAAAPPVPPVCPIITLAPLTAPNGTVGVAYNQTVTGSGGTGPYTFAVASGTLPAGVTLSTAGVLSGTPTTAGSTTVTIRGTDANGCSGVISYTITIAAAPPVPPVCPIITLAPLTAPNGTVGVAYNQTISGSGGTAPYTFGVTVGTLPTGLTLTPAGVLAGTPTVAGTFNFTVRGADANGCFTSVAYTVVIAAAPAPPPACPVITLTPATLPNGTVGVAYSQTITGNGGTGPYTFGVISGALPAGLTLTAAGLLAGTPTTLGSTTVTIRGTASNGCFGDIVYTINVAAAPVPPPGCPPITVTPVPPNGTVGVAYLQALSGAGGTAPFTFGVPVGVLPAGLTMTSAGVISGTPTVPGASTFSIRRTDAAGCFNQVSFTITIAPVLAVPTLPQTFMFLLALGLTGAGYVRLRQRARG